MKHFFLIIEIEIFVYARVNMLVHIKKMDFPFSLDNSIAHLIVQDPTA